MLDPGNPTPIEIRVERATQLFDTLDPFPVPQRDLAKNVEEYVVGWARELPSRQVIEIVVHLPASEVGAETAEQLRVAFSNFFHERADQVGLELKELFRIGRWSLLIGLTVLAACLLLAHFLGSEFGQGFVGQFSTEGLVVLGWVANWRPMEIFLYEWWPLVRRRNL